MFSVRKKELKTRLLLFKCTVCNCAVNACHVGISSALHRTFNCSQEHPRKLRGIRNWEETGSCCSFFCKAILGKRLIYAIRMESSGNGGQTKEEVCSRRGGENETIRLQSGLSRGARDNAVI